MGQSLPDYKLTPDWVDLTTLDDYSSISGATITIQAKYVASSTFVFVGGDTAPEGNSGILLASTLSVTSSADHWWVKGGGELAILVED